MEKFIEHIVPGLALALLGLWHTINTTKSYCNNNNNNNNNNNSSSNFTVKYWYPIHNGLSSSSSRFKHLEPALVLSLSIFSLLDQLFTFPTPRLLHLSSSLVHLEHATIFLNLAIFAAFLLCTEITRSSHLLSGVTGILAASVFGQELFLLHFHSADHSGLEGHYHWLLQLIIMVSLVASLASTFFPASFPAALLLSVSILFQGCWFINMACMLWLPRFIPHGCAPATNSHSGVTCASPHHHLRATALANLQFSWILSGIMLLTASICLKSAAKSTNHRLQQYEQLGPPGSQGFNKQPHP